VDSSKLWQFFAASLDHRLECEGGTVKSFLLKVAAEVALCKWEKPEVRSNGEIAKTSNPYDLRVTIPKSEHQKIAETVQSGKTQTEVATEYKVSPRRIGQILKMVKARKIPEQTQTTDMQMHNDSSNPYDLRDLSNRRSH